MALLHDATAAINETNDFIHCPPSSKDIANSFLSVVMIIEMIVGLPGVIVALWIFCCRMKKWKPHTLLLFNLVLADFLLLVSLPFRIDTDLRNGDWIFGRAWCSINLFMLAVNRSASIAFMTALVLDRYFKVVHPHHSVSRATLTQVGWLAGLLWTVAIALPIPLLTTNLLHQDGNVSHCRSFNSYKVVPASIQVLQVTFIAEFLLPWVTLLFCTARITRQLLRRRLDRHKVVRRAIRVVMVIVLVFSVCFMPSVLAGLGGLYLKNHRPKDCKSFGVFRLLFKLCIGFTYLNSALDPVIYVFSCRMFRDVLKNSIRRLSFKKKKGRPANRQHK